MMIFLLAIAYYTNAYHLTSNSNNTFQNKKIVASLDQLVLKYNSLRLLDFNPKNINNYTINQSFRNQLSNWASIEESKNFMLFASSAYCNPTKLLNWSCSNCIRATLGTERVTYFSSKKFNTAGYIAVNHSLKLVVISYRGTTDTITWMQNYNTKLIPLNLEGISNSLKVHSGFWEMAKDLNSIGKASIFDTIQGFPNYRVLSCGHSLGGALAVLSALQLSEEGIIKWDRLTVITYGEPRVGNSEFASYINSKPLAITRVTSYGDLVTVLPPKAFGYEHHQYNLHIDKTGNLIECSIYGEDDKCTNDFLFPIENSHFSYFGDRFITNC